MRNIKPLTGQVLVEILPPDTQSHGGVALPEHILSPEEVQATHRRPEPPKPLRGVVRAIGPWPKTRSGLMQMPEFGIGALVIVPPTAGIQMHRNIGERFQMVRNEQILAVLT